MNVLFIRSQNKESIRQACEFRINSHDNMFVVTAITARGNVENLGSYTTYEKAMKVMDMIQWHLDEGVFECRQTMMLRNYIAHVKRYLIIKKKS